MKKIFRFQIRPHIKRRTRHYHRRNGNHFIKRFYCNETPTQHTIGKIDKKLAIIYNCGVCTHQFTKSFSHHAYTKGVVIIQCPSCENLHLIADHLGWFDPSQKIGNTIEETMQKRGGHKVEKFNIDEFLSGEKFKEMPSHVQQQILAIKHNFPKTKKNDKDSNFEIGQQNLKD